ncbi:MAG: pyruvate/2-oxoglutarate dehydrogenase complex dihydrolipoamide dehydrogenase (E3) component [Crocinitomix sp.]|jgi:pyruvate/2-oxoglutarate dehydrogenase complex dihydrolipoamide dehydrogenase (E3) component
MKKFDAIIIGSGQAGTPLVFDLASRNKKVAFIEKNKVGGTCLNVGCTPTKTYVASARRMWDIAHSSDLGIDFKGEFKANMSQIKQRKDKLIKASTDGIEGGIEKNENITYYHGEAQFVSDYVVSINDEEITAPQIFINVGGRPFVPEMYENVPYLTNRNILELEELPEHLIIIGGSYIGLEFGQIFKRFGSKITIIERGERIISREDVAVSEAVTHFLKKEGVAFIFNSKKIVLDKTKNGIQATINGSQTIKGSHVLLAIGRKPNSDVLSLENTTIQTTDKGFIAVDEYCETNVAGVFALGDCNGRGAFTHTAYNDFQIVQNYLFGNQSRKISSRISTYGLFVDPPLGRCGMNKTEALAKGINVLEGKREMSRISRAKEKGETHGFMSVLVNADTDKIIGATILGVGGDEIITSILNVMYADQSYKLIRDSIVAHPTISELIPTTLEKLSPVE